MRINEIKESGRPLVVSVSGGKDSTAVILHLKEQEVEKTNPVHYVFADTGWEHPEVYLYLNEVVNPLCNGKLNRVQSKKYPGGMADLAKGKGMFASRQYRFCTSELKVVPIVEFLGQFDNPVNVVGIRAQESFRRSKMDEWDEGGPMNVSTWRPLIDWIVDDVIGIHTRHGITPCSLYLRDELPASRVGCFPCLHSRKAEIRAVAEDPFGQQRLVQIRSLEKELGDAAQARNPENARPTFFQSREAGESYWPIDEVIAWSKTSWGGKQIELFTPRDENARGCMMWGLCDVPDKDGEFSA